MNTKIDRQLTTEEQKEFANIKSDKELNEFIAKTGFYLSDSEKALVLTYIEEGKLPLNDEKLKDVAGGFCFPFPSFNCDRCGKQKCIC